MLINIKTKLVLIGLKDTAASNTSPLLKDVQ